MRLSITLQRSYPIDRNALFDFTNDVRNFVTFVGFGIVPGIREARYETPEPPHLGSRRRVLKTDGSEHVEEIVAFERPAFHVARISGLTPPLSWLVREAEDAWWFVPLTDGARIKRTFTVQLTSALWFGVALLLMHVFLRVAISRDLENIAKAIRRDAGS